MTFKDIQIKVQHEAKKICNNYLKKTLEFNLEEASIIANEISHKISIFIKKMDSNYKYIINTTILEKGNLGY